MAEPQKNNPLHGITLKAILEYLIEKYWRAELGKLIDINCFINNPSLKSSLTFLRKHEWARKDVEELYLISKEREQQ